MTAPDLRAWADRSEAEGYECLGRNAADGRARTATRFGGCVAYPTGRRSGFFNPILVLEATSAEDLRAAVEWLRAQETRLSLRVREDWLTPEISEVATELGLVREDWAEVVMVLHPLAATPAPPALPPGLTIERATAATLDRFHAAAVAGYDMPPAGLAFMADLFPPAMVDDPDVGLFSGWLDGQPVACSGAIRGERVVGVYSVGTTEWARRRGIGAAMTWAAVAAGVDWGCEAAALQASEMGASVYRSIGFEPVSRYVTWLEPPPAAGG